MHVLDEELSEIAERALTLENACTHKTFPPPPRKQQYGAVSHAIGSQGVGMVCEGSLPYWVGRRNIKLLSTRVVRWWR